MPGLEHIRPNYHTLSYKEKVLFIKEYRKRRSLDMAKPATYGKVNKANNTQLNKLQSMGLTTEEIAIAKSLGLKPKDILALKEKIQ